MKNIDLRCQLITNLISKDHLLAEMSVLFLVGNDRSRRDPKSLV